MVVLTCSMDGIDDLRLFLVVDSGSGYVIYLIWLDPNCCNDIAAHNSLVPSIDGVKLATGRH